MPVAAQIKVGVITGATGPGASLGIPYKNIITVLPKTLGGQPPLRTPGSSAKPKVLMLDEPSLGLAPLIVKEIFHIVADLRSSGVAVLLVEQNARAALQVSDYGYVLETGRLSLEGPSAELANDPAVMATYLGGRKR